MSAVVDLPGKHRLRGWLYTPSARWPGPRTPLVYCLAGGRCTTAYFDLHVDGLDGWSMAEHLASRGAIVVALDHLGIGASSTVDDIFGVTPRVLAAAHARALEEVAALVEPDVFAVGLGHSMGGMIASVQQARHDSFDALVVLGTGGDGLPQFLEDTDFPTGDALHERLPDLARAHFARPAGSRGSLPPRSFFLADVPREVRAAFLAAQAELLPSCGITTLIPGSTDIEKATITAPLFLGFGDHDLTDEYLGSLTPYRSVTDAALYVLRGSAHCHNQAVTRTVLWERIVGWLRSLGPR